MMNDKNIDDLFRDKLKGLEKAPPAYLFDNVMAGVSAMRRKRRLMYWRIGTVAAALMLAFVAGWQISEFNQRGEQQTMVVQQQKTELPQHEKTDVQKTETHSVENTQTILAENKIAAVTKNTNSNSLNQKGDLSTKRNSAMQDPSLQAETFESAEGEKAFDAHTEIQEQPAALVDEPAEKTNEDQPALSIDQQIMEQNMETIQARHDGKRKNRWIVGAQVSPAININRSSHSAQYASSMLNASNPAVDLGAGLSVEYKPSKRWSVQSGVYYAGLAQTSENRNSSRYEYANADNIGTDYFNAPVNIESDKVMMNSNAGVIELKSIPSGMVVGASLEDKSMGTTVVVSDAKFIQNFQYLEIPLYLRYTLLDARFDVELMGGVSSNVLVGNNTYLDSNSGKSLIGKTQDMQDLSYSSTFGLGLKYGLSKRIYLNVEPRVKYYLNSLSDNPQVNYKPYTIGVFTGISYQF